jgi:hypothetical protein
MYLRLIGIKTVDWVYSYFVSRDFVETILFLKLTDLSRQTPNPEYEWNPKDALFVDVTPCGS